MSSSSESSSSQQQGQQGDWRAGLEVGGGGGGGSGNTGVSPPPLSPDPIPAPPPTRTLEWWEMRLPPSPLLPGQPGSQRRLGETHMAYLPPFFNPEQAKADHMMGSAFGKFVLSGVMGGALGLVFGAFMTTMSFGAIRSEDIPTDLPLKRQFQLMGRRMWASMRSSSKNFALFGAVYTPTEQMTAVVRGKHDIGNSLISGCVTGAGMAVTGGPYAMGMGCVGCAALCGLMDHFFIHKAS